MKKKIFKKQWLKKSKPKNKHDMKIISQKRMNTYFIGGLVGIVSLSVLTIGIALLKTAKPTNNVAPKVAQTAVKTDEVDHRLEAFLTSFVTDYFNVPKDGALQDEQRDKLLAYYNFVPEIIKGSEVETQMTLLSSKLLRIKDKLATYRVTYEVGEDKKKVTVLFGVPFGGSDGAYYVSGLPYYEAVKDYKAEEVPAKEELRLDQSDGVEEEDRTVMLEFLELFFKNYTTNQENLDLIANDVSTITGTTFNSIDWSYFKKDGKQIKAYVQANFTIAGVSHSENFTLTIVNKDDGFYVSKMEHRIPVDYAK
ncbi:conjugal transfer protein [Streptococcus pluranimalium]|uniref:conjugal transfer protein n=1 Tax=Streptococcus pluranimalium TaxID=82348 RepID=UPI003465112B